MAITMQTADSSVEVQLPPEEAHKKWLAWTGKGGPGMPQGTSEGVTADQIAGLEMIEQGTCHFEPGRSGGSRAHMELRYNPAVIQEEGLEPGWLERRMAQYLERFKKYAEGRQA